VVEETAKILSVQGLFGNDVLREDDGKMAKVLLWNVIQSRTQLTRHAILTTPEGFFTKDIPIWRRLVSKSSLVPWTE
jgi:hypothetical protein